jgi:hypothetical protein
MKMLRSKVPRSNNKPIDIAAARNEQRRKDNQAIIDRIQGVPASDGELSPEQQVNNPDVTEYEPVLH